MIKTNIADKVLFEIYRADMNGEQMWFSKLVNNLGMDKRNVSKCLRMLCENDVILSGYDYIDDEHLVSVFSIHDGYLYKIGKLYDEYYKQN